MPELLSVKDAAQVAAAHRASCVLFKDKSVACAGDGRYGKLGNGGVEASETFVRVASPADPLRPPPPLAAPGGSAEDQNKAGYRLLKESKHEAAAAAFRAAIAQKPAWDVPHYNLACALAYRHSPSHRRPCDSPIAAIMTPLKESVRLNPGRGIKLWKDPDLEPLHGDVAFVTFGRKPLNAALEWATWISVSPEKRVQIDFMGDSFRLMSDGAPDVEGTMKVNGRAVVLKVNGKPFATGKLTKELRLSFPQFGELTDDRSVECD